MKVGEFAQRARAQRLCTKSDVKTCLERSRFDLRKFDPVVECRTSALRFHAETKCRMEALIPYPPKPSLHAGKLRLVAAVVTMRTFTYRRRCLRL
jgi:hypothetical protein